MSGLMFNHGNGRISESLGISEEKEKELKKFIIDTFENRRTYSEVIEDFIDYYGNQSAELVFGLIIIGGILYEVNQEEDDNDAD